MMKQKSHYFFLFCFMLFSSLLTAQTISGTVTDESGEPLIGANVVIKGTTTGVITDYDGKFSLDVGSLPTTLAVSYTGYNDKDVEVTDNSPLTITLAEGIELEGVVVSASRKPEKVQDAPASISVLGARQLEASPQSDAVRNLVNVPGVQLQQQSAARINIEMRGASGIFGTSAFPIMDYRSLVGPGLGVFQSDASGINTIDLKTIEVVRGPGSALYGPGVTSGVIHFITKNPIDYPGTTVQVGYGELNTLTTALRHAWRNEGETFGYKITASFNQGDEFTLDGTEGTTDAAGVFTPQIDKFATQIIEPAVTNEIVDLTQPGTVLLTQSDLDPDGDGNMMQNDFQNYSAAAHLEFRPQDDLSINVGGGFNYASAVFYNDLGEGLSQAGEYWLQARAQKGGLFGQVFFVDNNGGSNDKPTFLYQSGNRTNIGRKQVEGQLQYNFDVDNLFKGTDITVGADYRLAINETLNLTYGRQEDDDNYQIFGGYAQAKFALTDKLDFLVAGRYDNFNFLDEGFFSPRAALVFKPSTNHTIRASFNRAGSPPTGLQMNIDFPVNAPVPGALDFWLAGMWDTQKFDANAMQEFLNHGVSALGIYQALGGENGPFTLGQLQAIASQLPQELALGALGQSGLSGALVHDVAYNTLLAQLGADPTTSGLVPLVQAYFSDPANVPTADIGVFYGVNASDGTPLNALIDTNAPELTTSNTIELGYKGLIAEKFSVSLDIYNTTQRGFNDFTQIAPFIQLINKDYTGTNAVAAGLGNFIATQLIAGGMDPTQAAAAAAAVGEGYGGISQLVPEYFGTSTVETSSMPQGDGITHVAMGYRIFPDAELKYWGADLGLEYYFNENFSAFGNYSWVSKNRFDAEDLDDDTGTLSYSLNVPLNKFRLGVNYSQGETGFRGNLSFQHDDAFEAANIGQYSGDVVAKNLVDLGIGYKFPFGLTLEVAGNNIFNQEYRTFTNMPIIGRRILGKATYQF